MRSTKVAPCMVNRYYTRLSLKANDQAVVENDKYNKAKQLQFDVQK